MWSIMIFRIHVKLVLNIAFFSCEMVCTLPLYCIDWKTMLLKKTE